MIPSKPPPSFRERDQWSTEFIDFVSRCLVKDPEERATAVELLEHDFIRNCKPISILTDMIEEAKEMREREALRKNSKGTFFSDEEDSDQGTMVRQDGTFRPGTSDDATLLSQQNGPAVNGNNSAAFNFSTMIINDEEKCEDSTMQRHDTVAVSGEEKIYRPAFLDHFDQSVNVKGNRDELSAENIARCDRNARIAAENPPLPAKTYQPIRASSAARPFVESDFDFLKFLSYDELHMRMSNLDNEMEQEIEELRRRYQGKRQPILEAIDAKKQRQLNF